MEVDVAMSRLSLEVGGLEMLLASVQMEFMRRTNPLIRGGDEVVLQAQRGRGEGGVLQGAGS